MSTRANQRVAHVEITDRQVLGDNHFRATIAVNDKARQPPILRLSGLDSSNYERNPVVMFAHDTYGGTASRGLPIGKTLRLNRPLGANGPIEADFEFDLNDDFARLVKSKWEDGFIRAASISWIPLETELTSEGPVDVRSDMLEWSIVSVPADADAVRELEQAYFRQVSGLSEAESDSNHDGDDGQSESLTEDRIRDIFHEEFTRLSITGEDNSGDETAVAETGDDKSNDSLSTELNRIGELARSLSDGNTN